jgi:hypothetical protein
MALATDDYLYLHIPKTGGVWLSYILRKISKPVEVGHQHSHFPYLLNIYDEDWYKQRSIFTMVRHPVTWYQSRWAFRMKHGWQSNHPLDFNCASNDFNQFVKNCLDYKPDGWYTHIVDLFTNNVPGGLRHTIRLEDGINGIMKAFDKIDLNYDVNVIKNVPRANDSDMGGHNSKYWAKYSQGMFDRVMRVERNVIDRYYHNFIINPSDHVGQRPW